jgi:HEAT repeat protein
VQLIGFGLMVELRNKGRWRKKLWILLGCGIAAILLFTLLREREPRYAGDTLSEWVYGLVLPIGNPERDPERNTLAENAIKHIGTNALPFLIKWIQYEERPWRTRLNALCSRLPEKLADRFSYFLDGRLVVRRDGAFSALRVLGPDAAPAIPTLIHLVQTQPLTIQQSLRVLAAIGGDGLTPVLHILNDQASPNRLAALNAILYSDFEAKRPLDPIVVSALTNCLTEANRELAFCAAQILCTHDSEKRLAIKTLLDALESPRPLHRQQALLYLKISLRLGYSVPALLQFLQDTNSPVSPYSARVLGEMADDGVKLPETVLPALTNSLHDPRPLVRSYAASAVFHFREAAEPAAPALLDLWNDPDNSVRLYATNAFFELPAFSVLKHADKLTPLPAGINEEQQALYKRFWPNPTALIRLLDHSDPRVRTMATNAFQKLKEASGDAPTVQIPRR